MKATPQTLISLSLILFFIHTNSLICANAQEPVRDYDGDEIRPGVEYYVFYAGFGFRSGIGLPPSASSRCPASVIEMPSETQSGFPVVFQPGDSQESVILESTTDVHVSFGGDAATGCPDGATVWSVDEYDEEKQKSFVVAGSLVENPSSYFRLLPGQKGQSRNVYKFAICPIAGVSCIDVGVYTDSTFKRFALNTNADDLPYPVSFFKAQSGRIRLPK